MKIVTWNVNNRVGVVSQQVQELGRREPDVVALQDVNSNAVGRSIEEFCRIGLAHVLHTRQRQSKTVPTGVLLASRFPISLMPELPEDVLWNQGCSSPDRETLQRHWARRTLFALLHSPWGDVEVANVSITPGNHYEKDNNGTRQRYTHLKLDLLAGVYSALATPAHRPRVLCGDFNAPQHEQEDGEIITFGYNMHRNGTYVIKRLQWHGFELAVLGGLGDYDLHDVYRGLRGYGRQTDDEGWSWRSRCRRYRFDHLFASSALRPAQADYLHALRERGLSDHAPLEVLFHPVSREETQLRSSGDTDESKDGRSTAFIPTSSEPASRASTASIVRRSIYGWPAGACVLPGLTQRPT